MRGILFSLIFISSTLISFPVFSQGRIQDYQLLSHSTNGSIYGSENSYTELARRSATASEASAISYANDMMDRLKTIKAIILIDKGTVVYDRYTEPASVKSTIHGYSITKTFTSIAVGQAICENLFGLNDRVGDIDPGFKGTQYETATIQNLLTMASGATSPKDGSEFPVYASILDGFKGAHTSLRQVTIETDISKARKGLFNTYLPGEIFEYKNSDPVVLSSIFKYKNKIKLSEYIYEKILKPAGVNGETSLAEDYEGVFAGSYGVRLMTHDWARLAIWVRKKYSEDSCIGNYIRSASKTQIKNYEKKLLKDWNGYGYYIWTDSIWQDDSFWAIGYGGQMIIWNHKNDRIMIAFSTAGNWLPEAGKLYSIWSEVK